ncbi:MAG: SPOR domain-containing protein, partial [Syntrophales bacterium]
TMRKLTLVVVALLISFLLMQDGAHAARKSRQQFQIQVSSYKDERTAREHAGSLRELGYPARYEKIAIRGKGNWYRVYIGKYPDRAVAAAAAKRLKASGMLESFSVLEASPQTEISARKKGAVRQASSAAAEKKRAVKVAQEGAKPAPEPKEEETRPAQPAQKEKPEQVSQPAPPAKAAASTPAEPESESQSRISLYNSALADFQQEKYRSALEKFSAAMREDLEPDKKVAAYRRMADCRYFIGHKEADNQELLAAVDMFKEILQKYPEGFDNMQALNKLARSYVFLKFYYEAKREFQTLYTRYPDSPHAEEALFMAGDMSVRTRNFTEAAEKFKEYVSRYPKGKFIKQAYFGAADACAQLQQDEQAGVFYREALSRWTIDEIPKESVLNLGYYYFRVRHYGSAADVFFLYLNLYPDDEGIREVYFTIARSFLEMEQYGIAVKFLSLLMERYPDSREALEGSIVMANIGVKKPGLKMPDLAGVRNYRDPISAYNELLAKPNAGELVEGLLLQKSYALFKTGRYEDAFNTNVLLVRAFPRGRYREEGIRSLISVSNHLVHSYHSRADYLPIARIYFQAYDAALAKSEDRQALYKIGDSLKRTGLLFDAKRVFDHLLSSASEDRNSVLLAMAEVDFLRGKYDDAERGAGDLSPRVPETGGAVFAALQKLKGDLLTHRGAYPQAASEYAKAVKSAEGDALLKWSYAKALKESDACAAAIPELRQVLALCAKDKEKYPAVVRAEWQRALAQCLLKERDYPGAIAMYRGAAAGAGSRESLWALFDTAKAYHRMKNQAMADKTFAEMKGQGGEEFWSNLADYYLREEGWNAKYGKYLKHPEGGR